MAKNVTPLVSRPRSIVFDGAPIRDPLKVQPRKNPAPAPPHSVLGTVPVAASLHVAAPAKMGLSLEDTMADVAQRRGPPVAPRVTPLREEDIHGDNEEKGGATKGDGAAEEDEEEEEGEEDDDDEEEKVTMLPDNGVYCVIADMMRFLEEESIDQRSQNNIRALFVCIRGSSDIIDRLGRAGHSANNWDLAKVALNKVAEHLGNLSMEIDTVLTFNKKRALNVAHLSHRAAAVAAGAIPTLPTGKEGANDDSYLLNFNNDTLAPYATTERLVLSSFETSQS